LHSKIQKNARLPPIEFLHTSQDTIPESHFLTKKDFEELDNIGFVIKDNFLGKEKLLEIWEESNSLYNHGKLQRAGMGTGASDHWVNEKARSDHVLWLNSAFDTSFDNEGIDAIRKLINTIDQIRHQLNEDINLDSQKIQMHLTCYPGKGARYMRHLDAYVGASARKITCLYYINPNWKEEDGGQLRIFDPKQEAQSDEKFMDIAPLGDRLLIFQSRVLEHEVLPVHAHRFALTVWFY